MVPVDVSWYAILLQTIPEKALYPSLKAKPRQLLICWIRRLLITVVFTGIFALSAVVILHWIFPFPRHEVDMFYQSRQGGRVLADDGTLLRTFVGQNGEMLLWADLDKINPYVRQGTLAIEDSRFLKHTGVDFPAIMRAIRSNFSRHRRVSGASTLTMQLVKQFRHRPRNWRTKVIEAFRAMQIERLYNKRKLLEFYLNSVPYGGNLIGVEAAALRYFGKHAENLTLGESALLSGLPQAPSRMRPDRHPKRAQERRNQVLREMARCGYITTEECQEALREPVVTVPPTTSFLAPHFCQLVRTKHRLQSSVETTIRPRLQKLAERALEYQLNRLFTADIFNGAVVVLDSHSSALLAMVGSPSFWDKYHAGEVNAALAQRSPGSTLKPFLYAMAFERGLLTPETVVPDIPREYADYRPWNVDGEFRGLVPAGEALADSLNIPAIDLQEEIGTAPLYELLHSAGIQFPKGPEHYGLALAMGGSETSLLALTNAYAVFARGGNYRPVQVLAGERAGMVGRQILSRSTCFLISEALSKSTRLEALLSSHTAGDRIRVAWKTGTSNGFHDAWTVAYTPEFTVGVWLGNADGKDSPKLIGSEVAAPLAIELMDIAYGNESPSWFKSPVNVRTREVCSLTGRPIGEHCPIADEGTYIYGTDNQQACRVHRKSSTGEVIEEWPSEIAAWQNQQSARRGSDGGGGARGNGRK